MKVRVVWRAMARRSRRQDTRPYRRLKERLREEGGVCHLCGLPIDPTLKSPHPLSFSVDHLVPISLGGDLEDGANAAPAHRICNMKRGNGRGRRAKTEGDRSAAW